ncbi:conserved hypothetical protein [Nostocoides japonicum T1-X7]|uniref:Uncharacterized protein n=1 Tax=Nostocoides japonicum T1-X7 TaxID=1194083 RepID=A0A077M0K6_9MICO|nr:hypothetical protein [Tetrasphaera japonica]CCH77745.1 conserved hypothetical protein [Tetrasphaera japonica T1-X7]
MSDDARVQGREDVLTLRFVGEDGQGRAIDELRAAHVAEVLQGLVGLSSDFAKAGAFGGGAPPEVLVRPAREGSFVLEVVNYFAQNPETVSAVGVPSIGSVLWWSTKSLRADVSDVDYLDNGKVKVKWQNDTVDEVPQPVWEELNKRKRRRRRHLRQIMAPLSDPQVTVLDVSDVDDEPGQATSGDAPETFTIEREDYHRARPEDEVEETHTIFETEAQMGAVDFDSGEKWRVKTPTGSRVATVEDADFLLRVDRGLALHKTDIFNLTIREDKVTKNGQTRRTWTVLRVDGHRRGSADDDDT